jgi:ketosteroid isomerase-like protein
MASAAIALADATPLDGLVAAERGFSDASLSRGMRDAFLSNLADEAIIFRPGPINGRKSWLARTSPKGTLIWEPSFAELSGAGDIGYDTGPWEYRPPADSTGVVAPDRIAYGHFVSVWKRYQDGEWRVVLDIGIGHPKSEPGVGSGAFTAGPIHAAPAPEKHRSGLSLGIGGSGGGVGVGVGSGGLEPDEYRGGRALNAMMTAERSYGFELKKGDVASAYGKVAADDVRFYREGAAPTVGPGDAIAVLAQRHGMIEWTQSGHGFAQSYDLGYTYGLLTLRAKDGAKADTSAFVHVWRKDPAGKWKLALDIENEFPKAK